MSNRCRSLLLAGFLAWRQYLTTRPRWLRERIMQAKRSKGAPKASKPGEKVRVSIVVTDVTGGGGERRPARRQPREQAAPARAAAHTWCARRCRRRRLPQPRTFLS